jgi:hypothetical protein
VPQLPQAIDSDSAFIKGLLRDDIEPFQDRHGAVVTVKKHPRSERLFAGGPAVRSPDGRVSVRPIADERYDGCPGGGLRVVIAAGQAVLDDPYVCLDKRHSDLIWGPNGSAFAVIRSISENWESYKAYDLRTGLCLCKETWVDLSEQHPRYVISRERKATLLARLA